MLPRRSIFAYFKSESGFFPIAALVILLALGVAIYILAGQLKNPTSWISQAEGEPSTCTGKLEIPSCYEDGTPTAINVSWEAPKNPDRDCNVYLNGSDPGAQQVVSTECSGQKTYTYTTDRLLGNPLGNQDIYQLGIDNGLPGCSVKQLAEIRATEMCQGKKTAGPKPAPPAAESTENCTEKIQANYGITFKGFSNEVACIALTQLKDLDAKYSIVQKVRNTKTIFSSVDVFNLDVNVCENNQIQKLSGDSTSIRARLLANYTRVILFCSPEKDALLRESNNLWSEYGGLTPATYNPKPLKADPQPKPTCNSAVADTPRENVGEITQADYEAALNNLVDPNFFKSYNKARNTNRWCTDQNLYDKGVNARHCQFAEKVILKTGQKSICGQTNSTLTSGNTQFGIQIDYQGSKVPKAEQFKTLSAQWSRFVYKYNYLPNLDANPTSKLVVFNQQSFIPSSWPIGKTDVTSWDNYIDKDPKSYFKSLESFVRANSSKIQAIEVWNEPDLTSTQGEKTSFMPPAIYAKMLRGAAKIIKGINPNIKVISGGMAGQDVPKYLKDMQAADKEVFAQVDGVGLHPYSQSPKGWGANLGLQGDAEWILDATARAANKPVWVTEIGQNFSGQDQATYIDKMYTIFKEKNIPMAGWYGWTDAMLGGPQDKTGYGLYDSSGRLKPSGEMFAKFAKGIK